MNNKASSSRILHLAAEIMQKTSIVNDHLVATGRPLPSFDLDGPVHMALEDSDTAEQARLQCIGAAIELRDLLQGPVACLRPAVSIFFFFLCFLGFFFFMVYILDPKNILNMESINT